MGDVWRHREVLIMLARVDGKSPLAYLSEEQRVRIRAHARRRILEPVDRLPRFLP